MFVLWALLAILCVLAGFAGCILPALPGPPLAYVGLVIVWAARGFDGHAIAGAVPWILLGATVVVTILDTLAPVWGAKRYGATRAGVWGSVIGMIVGIFVFPPFGMILGTFVGALVGEIAAGQTTGKALNASWGVFVGTLFGIVLKLAVCAAIAWFVVAEIVA